MKLNERLKKSRIKADLSYKFVAEQIDKSENTVKAYEKGRISPPINIIMKLANLYNVSSDYLLDFNTNNEKIDFVSFSKAQASRLREINILIIKLMRTKKSSSK